ncbi:phage integrase SAM-like domain-containing protein [Micromonospora pisi]|uniref:phage integrase SAM-like domain-containing protein n=1 Tax=Micromonospora pisi TaxID=589240 RepID=UPI000EB4583D|nr:phage integrase SAM-like domain-containing protein [Micromonospora pisi]
MPCHKDRPNQYRVTWRDPATNHRKQRTFTNRRDAIEFQTSRSTTPAPEPLTVARLCEQSIDDRALALRYSTAACLRSVCRTSISPFFGTRDASELTREMVADWVRWLVDERHYSPRTVRNHFRVLASATRRAVQFQILPVDPCSGVDLPRVPVRSARDTVAPARAARTSSTVAGSATGHSRDHDPIARLRRALHDATPDEIGHLLRELDA